MEKDLYPYELGATPEAMKPPLLVCLFVCAGNQA